LDFVVAADVAAGVCCRVVAGNALPVPLADACVVRPCCGETVLGKWMFLAYHDEALLADACIVLRCCRAIVLRLCRWGVASLADELAEPNQLCRLLLSSKVSSDGLQYVTILDVFGAVA
jgi:hypothetical protein